MKGLFFGGGQDWDLFKLIIFKEDAKLRLQSMPNLSNGLSSIQFKQYIDKSNKGLFTHFLSDHYKKNLKDSKWVLQKLYQHPLLKVFLKSRVLQKFCNNPKKIFEV